MRVLITGIAGFLGSRFAEWMLANVPEAEVIGFDDLSCGYAESVPRGAVWNTVNIAENPVITYDPVDYVFHFAAYAAEGLSPFIRRYNYVSNLLATANVVNYCVNVGVKRLVFTSSMAAYGRPWQLIGEVDGGSRTSFFVRDEGRPPFDEEMVCNPVDPYGIAKLACEQDIRCAGEQHGLDWCIIRPHNLYGPGQSIWQRYRNVLGIWMARRFQGLPLLVFGDGRQQRAFSYIDDCLPCLWEAATAPQASREVINLGGSQPVEIGQAARLLADIMPGAVIEHAPARHEVKEAWCSTGKSERLLGYRDKTPLDIGLRRMFAWAREAWGQFPERRQSGRVAPLEITRGLYPQWAELLEG